MDKNKSFLIQQAQYFEEYSSEFIEKHFPYASTDINQRKQMQTFITKYMEQLSQAIQDDQYYDTVFIGNSVVLQYDDQSQETYTICFPDESDPENNCISFLTPIGKQLLLKKSGQDVVIVTPGHQLQAKILKVYKA